MVADVALEYVQRDDLDRTLRYRMYAKGTEAKKANRWETAPASGHTTPDSARLGMRGTISEDARKPMPMGARRSNRPIHTRYTVAE